MGRRRSNASYYSKPLAKIHADFNGICALCGEYVELTDASRDHIIPRSEGGGNGKENIQLTHKKCNNLKGNTRYPDDWKEQLQRNISIPRGYRCSYCFLEITKQHKDWQYIAPIFRNGKILILHTWCNEERIKYGTF